MAAYALYTRRTAQRIAREMRASGWPDAHAAGINVYSESTGCALRTRYVVAVDRHRSPSRVLREDGYIT